MEATAAGRNLKLALDLYEFGEQMQRQRVRRLHPDATHEQIEDEIVEWRQRRPGAEHGDYSGSRSRRIA